MPQNKQAKFFYGYVVLAGYIFDVRGSYNLAFLILRCGYRYRSGANLTAKANQVGGEKGLKLKSFLTQLAYGQC